MILTDLQNKIRILLLEFGYTAVLTLKESSGEVLTFYPPKDDKTLISEIIICENRTHGILLSTLPLKMYSPFWKRIVKFSSSSSISSESSLILILFRFKKTNFNTYE